MERPVVATEPAGRRLLVDSMSESANIVPMIVTQKEGREIPATKKFHCVVPG